MSFDSAKTALDAAIAGEINALRTNGTLSQYLQNNQQQIQDDLFTTKDNNMRKVYGDLGRAIDTQKNTFYYYKRNKDLLNIGDIPLKRLEQDVANAKTDHHNAQRQYEINQWTSGNRMDTLFGYQVIFVAVLLLAIFTGLWRNGFVSTGMLSFITFALIVIVVLTFVIRVQYTVYRRNKRYWNKRDFSSYTGSLPTLDCPTVTDALSKLSPTEIQNALAGYYDDARGAVGGALEGVGGALSGAGAAIGAP